MTDNQRNMRREVLASTVAVGGAPSLVDVGVWFGDRAEYAQEQILGGALRDISRGAGDGIRDVSEGQGDAARRIGTGAAIGIAIAALTIPIVIGGVVIVASKV